MKTNQQAADLVEAMSQWSKENPKTAVAAVGVGAIATAYCAYKITAKLLS